MKPCTEFIAISTLFAGVACGADAGHAPDQSYPVRPVRIIVSNATGSSPEITGRIVANKLTAQTGQQFVVDTRPGASGIIGVELVKTATPDGYTVLVGSTTVFAGLPALKPNLAYDMERDFVPLTRIASVANVMAKVNIQHVPYKGAAQLLSKQGATAQPESPAAFAKYIREERNRIAGLAKSAGITID